MRRVDVAVSSASMEHAAPARSAVMQMDVAYAAVQRVVDDWAQHRPRPVRVLEAGCGSTTRVRLPSGSHLTGIDVSEVQLSRNTQLDARILGDLQTHDFGPAQFDLVICWDVLEHVPDPRRALGTMLRSLAPDGLLIIAVPNVWSVKGLVTKFTPFSVHAWFYRNIIGDRRVGVEHSDQFPTVLRLAMAPARMRRQAERAHCRTVVSATYESAVQQTARRKSWVFNVGLGAVGAVMTLLTAGRSNFLQSDAVLVFQRDAG